MPRFTASTANFNAIFCVASILMITVVGCNGEAESKVAMRRNCLAKLGQAYQEFLSQKDASPRSIEELSEFIEETSGDDKTSMEAVTRLRDRDIVLFWNAQETGFGGSEKYLLGFEAACPGNGGYIVMADGVVDHVNAKEFGELTEIPKKTE